MTNKTIILIGVLLSIGWQMQGQDPVASYSFFSDFTDQVGDNNLNAVSSGTPSVEPIISFEGCRRYVDFSQGGYLEEDDFMPLFADSFSIAFWVRSSEIKTDQKLIGLGAPNSN